MKKKYFEPTVDIQCYCSEDILTTSIVYDEEDGDYIGEWKWGD